MRRFSIKVLTVILIGVPLFSTSQATAWDDVKSIAAALAKNYKLESLANEFLFGSLQQLMQNHLPAQNLPTMAKNPAPLVLKLKAWKNFNTKWTKTNT